MSDWWRSAPEILGSDYERVYRLDPEAARREVDSILAMSGLAPGASVLDLCCGAGRHAVEFARRGFAVTGLDISPTFLDVARRKATDAGVRVVWVQGDMREVRFQDRFDLVVNLFGAWGYFATDAENEQVLRNVARAFRRGGRFVLDFFNHDWIIRHFQPFAWREANGLHFMERRRFDIHTGRHESHLVIIDESGKRPNSSWTSFHAPQPTSAVATSIEQTRSGWWTLRVAPGLLPGMGLGMHALHTSSASHKFVP